MTPVCQTHQIGQLIAVSYLAESYLAVTYLAVSYLNVSYLAVSYLAMSYLNKGNTSSRLYSEAADHVIMVM